MHSGKIRTWTLEQNEKGEPVVAVVQPDNKGAPVLFEVDGGSVYTVPAERDLTALWLAVFYLAEVADSADKAVEALQSIVAMGHRVRSILSLWKWRPPRT